MALDQRKATTGGTRARGHAYGRFHAHSSAKSSVGTLLWPRLSAAFLPLTVQEDQRFLRGRPEGCQSPGLMIGRPWLGSESWRDIHALRGWVFWGLWRDVRGVSGSEMPQARPCRSGLKSRRSHDTRPPQSPLEASQSPGRNSEDAEPTTQGSAACGSARGRLRTSG